MGVPNQKKSWLVPLFFEVLFVMICLLIDMKSCFKTQFKNNSIVISQPFNCEVHKKGKKIDE